MSDRCCRYDNKPLVQREGERDQAFALRRFCNQTCKNKLADVVEKERRDRECAVFARLPLGVMDFAPHEIVPRDGGYMPRIDRALPERSLTGSSAAWAVATGGE